MGTEKMICHNRHMQRRMRSSRTAILTVFGVQLISNFVGCSLCMAQTVLFDAGVGTTPNAQGWAYVADPLFGHSVTQTAGTTFTALDIVASADTL